MDKEMVKVTFEHESGAKCFVYAEYENKEMRLTVTTGDKKVGIKSLPLALQDQLVHYLTGVKVNRGKLEEIRSFNVEKN